MEATMEEWRPRERHEGSILKLDEMPPGRMLKSRVTGERLDKWRCATIMLRALHECGTAPAGQRNVSVIYAEQAQRFFNDGRAPMAAFVLRKSLWMMADTGVPDDVLFGTFFSIFTDGGNDGEKTAG